MGIADPTQVGNHGKQQVVALRHRLGNRLDDAGLRRFHQATLDLRAVGQRSGDTQRGIFHVIARGTGDLHRVQREDHQQHRADNGAHHQRNQRIQLHRALARRGEGLQIAH